MGVERQGPRQLGRRREVIDARCERHPAQVLAGQILIERLAREHIVRCGDINLGLRRDRIACVDQAPGHDTRRKSGNRVPRADTQTADEPGRSRVRHRRAAQDREGRRRAQRREGRHQDPVLAPFQGKPRSADSGLVSAGG